MFLRTRNTQMAFNTYFRASSYAMITVAMLSLVFAGGLQVGLAAVFAAAMILAWNLEGTKWQLSERVGLVIVLLSIPLFFLDWQYQKAIGEFRERLGVNALAHLIVFLSAVKLLQIKSDRDWVFLYLISFFELLLAAGLSFSPIFLVTLSFYLLCALSTVIAFEISKARRALKATKTRLLVPLNSAVFKRRADRRLTKSEVSRLPLIALSLLVLIFILALPLFLVAPRAGSAVISRGGSGLSNFIGFSENVTLGEIGELKKNNEVVMRVRVENSGQGVERELRWRGVALDEFMGRSWRKSTQARRMEQKLSERGFFQFGTTEALPHLITQTVFLEPADSAALFAAPRPVAIQGDLPFVRIDGEGSIQSRRHELDRIIYKAFSDTTTPQPDVLRGDSTPYLASAGRYLQVPGALDSRIADLTRAMIVNAHARNRYDAARAVESQLQSDYGYSLHMKASGPDPLADFLFNVRAGHCEYFSTAMAVMLRTQGIATRVVNGFLPGEYNEAAGAFTVRQSDAHSWVEVLFPGTGSWVTFDPTPAAGRTEPQNYGLTARLGKYGEALELIWLQYVVGYDKQEQRSLATSLNNKLLDYRQWIAEKLKDLRKALPTIVKTSLVATLLLLLVYTFVLLTRRIRRLGWRALTFRRGEIESSCSTIEFYQRLTALLAEQGLERKPDQTPLEFAIATGLPMPLVITSAYHRVRYGAEGISDAELKEIEAWLREREREKGK